MTAYISRALEPVVRRYSEHFKVVLLTGPRQVGKTTMLKHLIAEDAAQGKTRAYVSLDNGAVLELAKSDPALFLQRWAPPVLIDEIQKAPELLPYIKELVDESDEMGTVWLTGSQPFHLMQAASESLAGRVCVLEMLGLSNAELAGIASEPFESSPDYFTRRVSLAPALGVNDVYERMWAGCLPALRALPEDMRAGGYESYLDTYIMRDIRDLAQVGDELKFRRFIRSCAALTSRPVVYSELARLADISEKTAKTWLSLLESSYVIKIVEPYANNLIKRLSKQPIMHFLDTGLAAYLSGWTSAQTLEAGALSGQFFESYAFGELYKSFVNAAQVAPLYFFRTNDRKEIDLLLEQDNTLYPIEIKKTASPTKKDVRNMSALDAVRATGTKGALGATGTTGALSATGTKGTTFAMSDDAPNAKLAAFKRNIGVGCVVCMSKDTFPISESAWGFPVWAI